MTLEELESILFAPTSREENLPRPKNARNLPDLTAGELGDPERVTVRRLPRFSRNPVQQRDQIEILYLYSGRCTVSIDERSVQMEKGQALLMEPGAAWQTGSLRQEDILLCFSFLEEYTKRLFLNGISAGSLLSRHLLFYSRGTERHVNHYHFPLQNSRRAPFLIQELCCELLEPQPGSEYAIEHFIGLLQCELGRCFRETDKRYEDQEMNPRIAGILKYIAQDYATATLQGAANRFHLNPNYLSGILKEKTGYTFRELVIRRRMDVAQQLLVNSNLPVTEIARQVGYDNTTFFYQKFRETTGASPADFRRA